MSEANFQVCGSDGQAELLDNRIIVKRKGWFAMLMHKFASDKEMPIHNIKTVEMRDAGMLTGGSLKIHFIDGSIEEIKFQKKDSHLFKEFKEKLFERISA